MAVVKGIFLLPVEDNDGTDLTAAIDEVRKRLFVLFDGWTFEGTVSGSFSMPANYSGSLSGMFAGKSSLSSGIPIAQLGTIEIRPVIEIAMPPLVAG